MKEGRRSTYSRFLISLTPRGSGTGERPAGALMPGAGQGPPCPSIGCYCSLNQPVPPQSLIHRGVHGRVWLPWESAFLDRLQTPLLPTGFPMTVAEMDLENSSPKYFRSFSLDDLLRFLSSWGKLTCFDVPQVIPSRFWGPDSNFLWSRIW